MQIQVWFNLGQKCYQATAVTRGRPIFAHASADAQARSKRLIVSGKSAKAAQSRLATALGVKPSALEVVKGSMVYRESREHPNGWERPDLRKAVAA